MWRSNSFNKRPDIVNNRYRYFIDKITIFCLPLMIKPVMIYVVYNLLVVAELSLLKQEDPGLNLAIINFDKEHIFAINY